MKISIVHISDIHVREQSSVLVTKFDKLREIAKGLQTQSEKIIFIFTGDIANSGKKSEYAIFSCEISKLKKELNEQKRAFQLIFVPGNHDCDFSEDQSLRDSLLKELPNYAHSPPSESIVKAITIVQAEFFAFAKSEGLLLDPQKIINEVITPDNKVKFNIINTSWCSTLGGKQNLVIPIPILQSIKRQTGALNVTIHHHPHSWIDRSIASSFKKYTREFSDLVFTGHEHSNDNYSQHNLQGDKQYYFEAGEFHSSNKKSKSENHFKVIEIDTVSKALHITEYEWNESTNYFKRGDVKTARLYQNDPVNKFGETLDTQFVSQLKEPGMLIKHGRKKNLELRDFYIFPKLEVKNQDDTGGSRITFLSGEKSFVDFVRENKFISISGEDKSGKSSLAKIAFESLFAEDFLPLLIDGSHVHNASIPFIKNMIDKKCKTIYRSMDGEMYLQNPADSRVLIMDNIDKISMTPEKTAEALKILKELFGHIVILSDFNVNYNNILLGADDPLEDFIDVEIANLTNSQRLQLIEKWIDIGSDFASENEKLSPHQINKHLKTTIAEYGVPNYALFVVTYLQHMENESDFKKDSSITSNERLLSSLIDLSLATESSSTIPLSTKRNYLTELSFEIYSSEKEYLTEPELNTFHSKYCKLRDSELNLQEVWNTLIFSKILTNKDDKYCFKYSYLHSFFMANYLKLNITKPNFKTIIDDIIGNIHLTKNSTTVTTFSLYTSDTFLIDKLIDKANSILGKFENCSVLELSRQLKLKTNVNSIKLIHSENDEHDAIEKSDSSSLDEEYESIPEAVRLIKVLGLVLKNSIDTLEGEKRFSAVLAVFNLAARLMALQSKGIQSKEMEKHLSYLATQILEKHPLAADTEVKQEATKKIIRHAFTFVAGVTDIVSRSVGAEALKNTYQKIAEKDDVKMFEMYNLSIKMEWFRQFPEEELKEMYDKHEKELVPRPILRFLTFKALTFQLTENTVSKNQAICEYLGMDMAYLNLRKSLQR